MANPRTVESCPSVRPNGLDWRRAEAALRKDGTFVPQDWSSLPKAPNPPAAYEIENVTDGGSPLVLTGEPLIGRHDGVLKDRRHEERAMYARHMGSALGERRGLRDLTPEIVMTEGEEVVASAEVSRASELPLTPAQQAVAWIEFEGAVKHGEIVVEGVDLSTPPAEIPLISEETDGLVVSVGLIRR